LSPPIQFLDGAICALKGSEICARMVKRFVKR